MPSVLHIIDHNGLGGAQRLVAGLMPYRSTDRTYPLRSSANGIYPTLENSIIHPNRIVPEFLQKTRSAQIINLINIPIWLKRQSFDIIHCHLVMGWLAGIWIKLLSCGSIPPRLIFHEHNPYILFSPLYAAIAKIAARYGSILAVSQHIANISTAGGIPPEKITVLPNYVANDFFFRENVQFFSPNEQKWCAGHTLVGFAGRLVKIKGWPTLLNVADLLRDEPIKFIIAGNGPDVKKLHQAIHRFHLEDKIHLMGFIPNMHNFFNSLDILLFPSSIEPFGLVPLEAQACGVPVIAFNIDGVNEAINENNAMLIPNGDEKQMAEKLVQLATDKSLYLSLVEKGLQNVEKYKIESYLVKLNKIYQSVMDDFPQT